MGMEKRPIRWSSNGLGLLLLLLLLLQLQVQVEVGLCGVVENENENENENGNENERLYYIWPMPRDVRHGIAPNTTTLFVPNNFHLITQYPDVTGILKDAFARLLTIINLPHSSNNSNNSHTQYQYQYQYQYHGDEDEDEDEDEDDPDIPNSNLPASSLLQALNVVISSTDEQLRYGIDESYSLSIPQPDSPNPAVYAYLQAKTVYGALHGLQTFSQLCQYNFKSKTIEVNKVPWTIVDRPRFSYRGLLIDTSRHYLPLPVIKTVIDSMAYAKLNVLHWHIVDSQSFPLEIPSYPKLWDGAYSYTERYTIADASEIVSYAQRQGINVLAEIDVPGHARSWGVGYPSLWPSKSCQEPLDVSNEFTFKIIDGILLDFSKVFKFKFVHLGGDEVNTSCWTTTPRINKWLRKHGMNGSEAYQYFVLRAQKIALSHGYEIINWEETFNNFGNKLSRKTVVHNWLGVGVAQKAVAAGLRCIVSNQDKWYLDHLDALWQDFYTNEPLTNITKPKQQKLVIGGEVCLWGEHIDASDIEQTIWPRAAAAAERLWTSYDKLAKDPREVTGRLAHFRCLLNQRGIAAAPLAGQGRVAPEEPGSCYKQ
ncbi:Beta-hexosaminidase [Parasponia andersonii]|uniref:Beta-hexosaminidase n=1 Tax=Parasponia andersonii TaxID=3476 RepID=A0A2P5AP57_PARAD|nr:Beta-hexosaminidase [Parasponia andersonii]